MSDQPMRFLDEITPAAARGTYTVTVAHKLPDAVTGGKAQLDALTQTVEVTGIRLVLGENEVHGVYPPPGSIGAFHDLLPHITLERRVLPWETRLDDAHPDRPWLALLVFGEGELLNDPHALGDVEKGAARKLLVHDASADLSVPNTTFTAKEESQIVGTVRTTAKVFHALVPSLAETAYLAHVRTASDATGHAERRAAEFAFVVANRFPAREGGRYAAHLVSLEGHTGHISQPSTVKKEIRLLSLYAWSFASTPAAPGPRPFSGLRARLTAPGESTKQQDNSGCLLLRPLLPTTAETADIDAYTTHVKHLLDTGYAPLVHESGDTDHDYALYRGPLVPDPVAEIPTDEKPVEWWKSREDAYGVKRIGYHAAWTLGRSLALADQEFADALAEHLHKAHRVLCAAARLLAEAPAFQSEEADAASDRPLASTVRAALEAAPAEAKLAFDRVLAGDPPEWHTAAFAHGPVTAPAVPSGGEDGDLVHTLRRADLSTAPDGPPLEPYVAALLDDPDLARTVSEWTLGVRGGTDADEGEVPLSTLRSKALKPWLDGARLLRKVPFAYLVPHAPMLPPESMRFFRVDPNWAAALVEGALHAGIALTHDRKLVKELHDTYLANGPGPVAASGILIRSALVAAYPKTVVEARERKNDTDAEVKVLRHEHLAPDVLLCLFGGVPSTVVLREPFHGLHLGVKAHNETEAVNLRALKEAKQSGNTDAKKVGEALDGSKDASWVEAVFRTAVPRILDLKPGDDAGLLTKLWTKLPDAYKDTGRTGLSPAEFALQLVHSPEVAEITLPPIGQG